MFIFKRGHIHAVALIYVDDVLLIGNDNEKIKDVKKSCFSIKDLGPLKYFMGIEVARLTEGFFISQRMYMCNILFEIE